MHPRTSLATPPGADGPVGLRLGAGRPRVTNSGGGAARLGVGVPCSRFTYGSESKARAILTNCVVTVSKARQDRRERPERGCLPMSYHECGVTPIGRDGADRAPLAPVGADACVPE